MTEREEIDFEKLVELLSYYHNRTQQKDSNGNQIYDATVHFDSLKKFVAKKKLENFIEIKENNDAPDSIPEVIFPHWATHIITIKNLDISIPEENDEDDEDDEIIKLNEYYLLSAPKNKDKRKYSERLRIIFKNNKFIYKKKSGNSNINISLGQDNYITFFNNYFEYVDLRLSVSCDKSVFINLEKNKFIDTKITVNCSEHRKYKSNDPYVDASDNMVKLVDNKIGGILKIDGKINFFFQGKNIIDNITSDDISIPHIDWRIGQEIDVGGWHTYPHKMIFIELKKKAIKNHDKFQELILNREIIKLETKLLKQKKVNLSFFKKWNACFKRLYPFFKKCYSFRRRLPLEYWERPLNWELRLKLFLMQPWKHFQKWRNSQNRKSRQDRIVLWFGLIFSNHGISWTRPICWLLGVHAGITFFIFINSILPFIDVTIPDCHKGYLYIFFELFNPLSNLEEIIGDKANFYPSFLSFLNVVQKVFYALMVYEIIRVFRRFTVK